MGTKLLYLQLPIEHYLRKKEAITTIATALRSGHLSIMLGAGVSKNANSKFPSWIEIVRNISNNVGCNFDEDRKNDNTYLLSQIELVKAKYRAENKYLENVTNALYAGVEYDNSVLELKLLIAIGSMMMVSINRNSREFVNFNFDDLFEWYLEYYGYNIQIISSSTSIIGDAKSVIYHPHGFLPKKKKFQIHRSRELTFSLDEYDKAMRLDGEWSIILKKILSSKLVLMIGLSGEDSHIRSMCSYVYNDLLKKERPLGFIILPDNENNRRAETLNLQRGLIHLYIEHDQLSEEILYICRRSQDIEEDD